MDYLPKPLFIERMCLLLKDSRKNKVFSDSLNSKEEEFRVEEDVKKFFEYAKTKPKKSFRVNTLRISPDELIERLKKYNWDIIQPFKDYPEIIQIQSDLQPGELGKTKEHLLGYYYIQEITSMMPIIALKPAVDNTFLDLCASPGSKTTQAAAKMQNKGIIFANDLSIGRITILSSNLEKCGVTNTIITRHDGIELCQKFNKIKKNYKKFNDFQFDKILVDAPCSGEGNIRISPRIYLEWSEGMLERFGKKQKKLASSALELLKIRGEMLYSTCTHSPEENELVIQHLLNNYNIEILDIQLPIKTREGITEWKNQTLSQELKKCARIYHHDNDMEGFFLCKMRKLSDKIKEDNKR